MHELNQSARNLLLDGITNMIRNGRASRGRKAKLDCLWDVVLAFWLTRRSAWKRVDLLRRDHICQRAFLRFFFQIQLSRLARVPPMFVHVEHSRDPLFCPESQEGFSFPPDRSCDRLVDSFLFSLFFLFSFFPFLLFYFLSSSLCSFLRRTIRVHYAWRNNGTKVLPGSRAGQDLSGNSWREFYLNFYSICRRKIVKNAGHPVLEIARFFCFGN